MNKKPNLGYALLSLMLTASFLLAGCSSNATPTPTPIDAESIKTSAASTALAQLTEIALLTPTATNTVEPTATPTVQPSPTTQPTSATTPPTASVPTSSTGGVTSGDRAEYVSETIPDGTDFQPNASFTKTWTLKNVGTTTWTAASYKAVRVSGDTIAGSTSVALPKDVKPNETVEITVNMTAPSTTGQHTSYWKLQNAQGTYFGLGAKADGSFWVQIDVVSGASSTQPTSTQTSGSTSPTATQSSSGSGAVTSTSISLDNASYSGSCPHDMVVTSQFNLSQASTVTYKLEAGSDTPGYTFTLPAAVTSSFAAGTQTLVFYLTLTSSGSGWVKFHITSPVDVSSSQANFSITCK